MIQNGFESSQSNLGGKIFEETEAQIGPIHELIP